MNQRFRRNFAPVLGALALLALGLLAWAMLAVQRTRNATDALHAQFQPQASAWDFTLPEAGYAVFVYRSGERLCATLSLQPDLATLLRPPDRQYNVARGQATTLQAELAPLAADCDTLEVLVFYTRMPYHGRFEVRYQDGVVRSTGDTGFGA